MTASDHAPRNNEPAYVLHTYPYLETSLIVEALSRHAGRVALIARGAKRPRSSIRGQLQSFQPLELSWIGKNEPRTLRKAEWRGGQAMLQGLALLCGFYMNELLLKLLPRDDPHEALFDAYAKALQQLGNATELPPVLRRFELSLLRELGYGLLLHHEAGTDNAVVAENCYAYVPDHGPVARHNGANPVQVRGKTLLDLQREDFSDPITLAESKQLLRGEIKHRLGKQQLHTRQLLKDLQEL
ncbi:MAG: DNA repair protein RecO [Burkholderiales bacterium]|nr:DNA repair protein RecO [Pseudomonadota bacterium]